MFHGNTSTLQRRGAPYYNILPWPEPSKSAQFKIIKNAPGAYECQTLGWFKYLPGCLNGCLNPRHVFRLWLQLSFHNKTNKSPQNHPLSTSTFPAQKNILNEMNQHGWFHQSSHDKKPLSSVARCRRLRLILPLNPEDTTDWLRFWRQKLLKPELYPRSPRQLLFKTVITCRLRHVENYKAYQL